MLHVLRLLFAVAARSFHVCRDLLLETWGAPRIHGELKMLGLDISERTVLRWMLKAPRNPEPAKRWTTFLNNHREVIAAMDFFTVPTLSFGVLYCFFVIAHDRRRILHCNVVKHPSSAWVSQQLRETSPYDSAPRYLILDRDTNFGLEVINTVKSFGIRPNGPASEVPGRTALPNTGLAVVDETYWITSSFSTKDI
jgi:hypothetical protein